MQSKNQVVVMLGISIFKKSKKTVESNRSVNRVRIKRLSFYFAVATWTSNFTLYSLLYKCSGYVQSKNGVDLVEVNIFYKLEKTSSPTVKPKKIALLYLNLAA